MPSAAKRNYNSGPVSIEVYERHNRHSRETWHDVQAAKHREQRRVKQKPLYGDPNIGYEIWEEA